MFGKSTRSGVRQRSCRRRAERASTCAQSARRFASHRMCSAQAVGRAAQIARARSSRKQEAAHLTPVHWRDADARLDRVRCAAHHQRRLYVRLLSALRYRRLEPTAHPSARLPLPLSLRLRLRAESEVRECD